MLNKPRQRSRSEIILCILMSLSNDGAKIFEVQYKSYLSYRRLKTYLNILIQNGLIIYVIRERKFRMTQKGRRALKALTELDELMFCPTVTTKIEEVYIR
jgi:predicted transcriptional regulator